MSSEDHEALSLAHDLMAWASELVNGVLERNRLALNMQAISFLSEAKRDADLGVREVDMADRYMSYRANAECKLCPPAAEGKTA